MIGCFDDIALQMPRPHYKFQFRESTRIPNVIKASPHSQALPSSFLGNWKHPSFPLSLIHSFIHSVFFLSFLYYDIYLSLSHSFFSRSHLSHFPSISLSVYLARTGLITGFRFHCWVFLEHLLTCSAESRFLLSLSGTFR